MQIFPETNRDAHERKRFEDSNQDLTQNYMRVNRIMAFMMPAIMLVMNLTTLAILPLTEENYETD